MIIEAVLACLLIGEPESSAVAIERTSTSTYMQASLGLLRGVRRRVAQQRRGKRHTNITSHPCAAHRGGRCLMGGDATAATWLPGAQCFCGNKSHHFPLWVWKSSLGGDFWSRMVNSTTMEDEWVIRARHAFREASEFRHKDEPCEVCGKKHAAIHQRLRKW